MKVFKGHWNENDTIVLDNNEEIEKELAVCMEDVRGNKNLVYLFYPGDVPNEGQPVDKHINREDYLLNPIMYGVALYYQVWSGKLMFE